MALNQIIQKQQGSIIVTQEQLNAIIKSTAIKSKPRTVTTELDSFEAIRLVLTNNIKDYLKYYD